ncbi:MAG: hypothetical protein V2I33_18340 [Kangiellaceae bacterium]|jgi:hypothetical protein|nr:hypothetical protein [Kangiellaceae bacterium]
MELAAKEDELAMQFPLQESPIPTDSPFQFVPDATDPYDEEKESQI